MASKPVLQTDMRITGDNGKLRRFPSETKQQKNQQQNNKHKTIAQNNTVKFTRGRSFVNAVIYPL